MKLNSDKGRAALALLITKMWEDRTLEEAFINNPEKVLKDEGLEIPEGVQVRVFKNTESITYLTLSKSFNPRAERKKLASFLAAITPIAEGHEVRLVQNTEKILHIAIPLPPPSEARKSVKEPSVLNMVHAASYPDLIVCELETVVASNLIATSEIQTEQCLSELIAVLVA